ncbi:MAG: hypothetical protein PHG89_05260 [Gallionella sp.]|jgi:5-methylcytosine-specific restriction endonuclease McrA|nr:hypothetical protein [Gallionella sp.]
MRKLPKPCDDTGAELVAIDVFNVCISKVKNANLKTRLQGVRGLVAAAAVNYDAAASSVKLHTIKRQGKVGEVSKDEMVSVYTYRMVSNKQPGRIVYDQIINAPKYQRCPLCDIGTVNTLDHHLPKTEYLKLTVTPNNLVPSCMWCQGAKKTGYPESAEEQTIHPYFDDFESEVWLYAEVIQGSPAAFRYLADPPAAWGSIVKKRLNYHLATFELPVLYSSNAGSELSGIRTRLGRLLSSGGRDAVRRHLQEEAESWETEFKNSWKAAMYRAAAASDWFCDGGFAA